ncbi:MAG: hypothetical protein ACKPGI_11610 [Verrucomicrobiota bacterium]
MKLRLALSSGHQLFVVYRGLRRFDLDDRITALPLSEVPRIQL